MSGSMCKVSLGVSLTLTAFCALAIDVQVATDRPSYYPGERLTVLVTAVNPLAYPVTLDFLTSLQALYSMDAYTPSVIPLQVVTHVTIPALSNHTWSFQHNWGAYRPRLGNHTVYGQVFGYGAGGPATFTIVPAPTPPGDFLIDFDTIPCTAAPLGHLLAYEASGVSFRMIDGISFGLQGQPTNGWLAATVCTYPTGFNLVADFDRPIYGATVQVRGGQGRWITMIAKDSHGNVLASVTSGVLAAGRFSDPIGLRTDQPIATLEWWPNDPRSLVGIDNLYVEGPPADPASRVVLRMGKVPGGVMVSWRADVAHQGLEVSTNPISGPWQTVESSLGTNSVFLPCAGAAGFMRLRVR